MSKVQHAYDFTVILLIKEKYQPAFMLQLHWLINWNYKLATNPKGWQKTKWNNLWELIGYMEMTIMNTFYYYL